MNEVDVKALFLGPQSENQKFFKEMLGFMMDEHIHWRRNFHPDDKPIITLEEQRDKDYEATLQRTTEALLELSSKLKLTSRPWFSPRYLGHMNADTLMAANLAYMAAILYNPNNVAYEASTATTPMEIEVGKQFAYMFGYDPDSSWGHITADGTLANYESLWIARNLKSFPVAAKQIRSELIQGADDWELMNLSTDRILELMDRAKDEGAFESILEHSARGMGLKSGNVGKLLVSESKHYSWMKAMDVLGIGLRNMVGIRVEDNYRMDISHLKETIDVLIGDGIPILGVVAAVGTTEEGAVDDVHEIVRLRKEYEGRGISFYLHVDAAYGGYTRSVLLNEYHAMMDFHELKQTLHDRGIINQEIDWPTREVYDAYRAMQEADSITVDPHKMGYVPYAAGGIVLKDKRVLDLISYYASYVFDRKQDKPTMLGSHIMEGSKAGAVAAAVWVAHRVLPLNITGYGKLIGQSIDGAHRFYKALVAVNDIEAGSKIYRVQPLTKPDFNIVDFAFVEVGNTSLRAMNELNQRIYEECSSRLGPVYVDDFITSKTELGFDRYGTALTTFAVKLGIPVTELESVGHVFVLRSCVMSPYLTSETNYEEYWGHFMNTVVKILKSMNG